MDLIYLIVAFLIGLFAGSILTMKMFLFTFGNRLERTGGNSNQKNQSTKCEWCDKRFKIRSKKLTKYCSMKCRAKAFYAANKKELKSRQKEYYGKNNICKKCGKPRTKVTQPTGNKRFHCVPCHRIECRKRYRKNPEKQIAYQKTPERRAFLKKYHKKYQEKNRKRLTEYRKKYREAHLEYFRKYGKNYKKNHKKQTKI